MEVDYATKINQDPLEKFFGKSRQKRGAYGTVTCNEFSQSYVSAVFAQTHAIKTKSEIALAEEARAISAF